MKAVAIVLAAVVVLGGCARSLLPDTSPPVVNDLVLSPNPATVNDEVMVEVTVVERESRLRVTVSIDENGDGTYNADETSTFNVDAPAKVTLSSPVTWTAAGAKGVSITAESDGGVTTLDSTFDVVP